MKPLEDFRALATYATMPRSSDEEFSEDVLLGRVMSACSAAYRVGVQDALKDIGLGERLLRSSINRESDGSETNVAKACIDAALTPLMIRGRGVPEVPGCTCGAAARYLLDGVPRCWGCVDHETAGAWHTNAHLDADEVPNGTLAVVVRGPDLRRLQP